MSQDPKLLTWLLYIVTETTGDRVWIQGTLRLPTKHVPTSQSLLLHSVLDSHRTVSRCAQFVVVLLSRVLCGRFLFRLLLSHHQLKQSTMARPAATKVASLVALAASSALVATAHPLCFYGPDRAVSTTADATFCPDAQSEGFCCEPDEEAALVTKYEADRMSEECAPLYKEVRERNSEGPACMCSSSSSEYAARVVFRSIFLT